MSEPLTSYLMLCGGCYRNFTVNHLAHPDVYLCPNCTKRRLQGFDPQPQTAERPASRVYHVDHQIWPRDELIVLARTGDLVTVRRLMDPQAAPETMHIGELVPVGAYGRG